MPERPTSNDVAVVGMACRFPGAGDVNALWRLVRNGTTAFADIPADRWKHSSFFSADARDPDKTYARRGAFLDRIDEFAALHYGLAPRRVQVMDPQHRLVVEVVREALQDAGYERNAFDRANTGVFVGASVSEYKDLLSSRLRAQSIIDGTYGAPVAPVDAPRVRNAVAGVVPTRAFTIAGSLLNMMAATVSHVFDLSGPAFTLDAACSSALVAIHEAVVHLRSRQCSIALAGGVYVNLTPDNLVGFARIGAISPSGVCRPFDARADGFVMGEGAGVVVLKRRDDAERDRDRIYAVIRGSGCNNDGRSEGPMTPRPGGQLDVMLRAHRDAGDIGVETIGLVETHGTATAVGDVVEVNALKTFFDSRRGRAPTDASCYLSSIKANIGHTMSAAGVAGFMKAALALHHRTIPPQAGIDTLNPELDLARTPFRVPDAALPWTASTHHPRRAAVSSFGFGGTNAHVLLEEASETLARPAGDDELFVVSAATRDLLTPHLCRLADDIEELRLDAAHVAYTLACRTVFDARVAFVAATRDALTAELRRHAAAAQSNERQGRPRVAFLFAPAEERDANVRKLVDAFPSLLGRLEPIAQVGRETGAESVAETMLLAEIFAACGVTPDVVLGAGAGEFVAAAAARMISADDAIRLAARPGVMERALGSLARREPVVPVISGSTGYAYTSAADAAAAWTRAVSEPAEIVRAFERCDADIYVLMGARPTLWSLARQVLPNRRAIFVAAGSDEGAIDRRAVLAALAALFVHGAAVDARPVASAPSLVTLPPTPLQTQRYWAIEPHARAGDVEIAPATANGGLPAHSIVDPAVSPTVPQQAGHTTPSSLPVGRPVSAPRVPVGEPRVMAAVAAPAPSPVAGGVRAKIAAQVFAAVARISAFPEAALKAEHTLVRELGFDSLMLVDLDAEVAKVWPQLDGLSDDLVAADVTIAQVIAHIESALRTARPDAVVPAAGAAAPVAESRTTVTVSLDDHMYLGHHRIDGHPVLPFAVAMDYVADAGLGGDDGEPFRPFTIGDFRYERPVVVTGTTELELTATRAVSGDDVQPTDVLLRQDGAIRYRGRVSPAQDVARIALREIPPSAGPLALGDFYDRVTFHGPLLRGIASIDGVADDGIRGTVRGSAPKDWIANPRRARWTIDPLVVDSSFQLVAYWAWVKHRRVGLPLAFETYTQLAPFDAAAIHCTAYLTSMEGDVVHGTLAWHDERGRLLAIMIDATAQLADRAVRGTRDEGPADGPDVSTYRVDRFPEYVELAERLELADLAGLRNPYFAVHDGIGAATTSVNGNGMLNFSSYNYLGNVGDPDVAKAAKDAIDRYGTSVSASRVASGERPLHAELEAEIARFFGVEAALVFTSGHATNVTVIGHIVGAHDLVLHDALAHDSIVQGARLSGAKRRPFPHDDCGALDRTLRSLRAHYRRVLVCIEGVYSMDGDIADLPGFIEVTRRHRALLFVDEAHSAGVIGATGRGVGEYHGVARSDVDVWMGTLSKAFASCGGYIGGTRALIDYLKYTVPGFVYSVGISPPSAAAALAALQQLEAHPERVTRLQANAKTFLALLRAHGLDTGRANHAAIVPVIVGDSVLALRLSQRLAERAINVQPIVHPAVEERAARLRFFVSCTHTEAQLATAADAIAEELARLRGMVR